ncbi:MAG: hypothetical protein IJD88_00635 [Clostridia bacterium]|nr:hypothetical protein [Clostridia bacterium]
MEIKTKGHFNDLFFRFFVPLLLILIILRPKVNWFILCPLLILFLIDRVLHWISYGRTLKMDKDGCTITFLKISKRYKWTELETKRVEDYSNAIRTFEPFYAGVIFYKKKTRKPKWILPSVFSKYVHPFSFFYVYFNPHIDTRTVKAKNSKQPSVYYVEESEFLKQMAEWGVELEDTRK